MYYRRTSITFSFIIITTSLWTCILKKNLKTQESMRYVEKRLEIFSVPKKCITLPQMFLTSHPTLMMISDNVHDDQMIW